MISTICFLTIFYSGSTAQTYLLPASLGGDTLSHAELHKKSDGFGWYTPIEGIEAMGGNFNRTIGFLFEDSIVQHAYGNNTKYQDIHCVGSVFDPSDMIYELVGDGYIIHRLNTYTLDSLRFEYLYVRKADSMLLGPEMVEVVDTLILKFYMYDDLDYIEYLRNNNLYSYAKPKSFDKELLGAKAHEIEFKIPLRAQDTTDVDTNGWAAKEMRLSIDKYVQGGGTNSEPQNVCGFSMAFKTMLPFEKDDTLLFYEYDTSLRTVIHHELEKPLNYFGYVSYENNGYGVRQYNHYNNSFFTTKEFLYGINNFEKRDYLPSNFMPKQLFISSGFKTSTFMSVDSLSIDVKFTIFPNPVNRNEALMMDLSFINAEYLDIALYNLVGHKVKSVANAYYNSGEHQLELDISDLAPGVYLYTVQAGNARSTKKIIITD